MKGLPGERGDNGPIGDPGVVVRKFLMMLRPSFLKVLWVADLMSSMNFATHDI